MAEEQSPPTGDDKKRTLVILSEPVVRGDTKIESLFIRKPRGGELRGLTLQDVINTDFLTLFKLIPRISEPPITQEEAEALDPADLAEIGGVLRGFFMTSGERQLIEAFIEQHSPKT